MPRTPDSIMADFNMAVLGIDDLNPHEILQEIIADVLDSVELACRTYSDVGGPGVMSIYQTVESYVINHYGE